jgi:hypothetical protein
MLTKERRPDSKKVDRWAIGVLQEAGASHECDQHGWAIAQSEGEDLSDPETALSCVEVFALGGRAGSADASESGYFAVRGMLAKTVTEAARFVAERGVIKEGAPILLKFITQVAARFALVVTQKVAAPSAFESIANRYALALNRDPLSAGIRTTPNVCSTSVPDLEADQRADQRKADGISYDDYIIALEHAVYGPQGKSCRQYCKRLG